MTEDRMPPLNEEQRAMVDVANRVTFSYRDFARGCDLPVSFIRQCRRRGLLDDALVRDEYGTYVRSIAFPIVHLAHEMDELVSLGFPKDYAEAFMRAARGALPLIWSLACSGAMRRTFFIPIWWADGCSAAVMLRFPYGAVWYWARAVLLKWHPHAL